MYQGAQTKTMVGKSELLNKMEQDAYTKIIYGKEKAEYFDTFVKEWTLAGGEQIVKEVNDWYQSIQKK
ncbi:hypothetical protein D3C85_1747090 [compost metagenome]